jgi:hypothetical protein
MFNDNISVTNNNYDMVTLEKSLVNVLNDLSFQLNALDKEFISEEDFVNAIREVYDFYSNNK